MNLTIKIFQFHKIPNIEAMQKHTIQPILSKWNCSNYMAMHSSADSQKQQRKNYVSIVRNIPVRTSDFTQYSLQQQNSIAYTLQQQSTNKFAESYIDSHFLRQKQFCGQMNQYYTQNNTKEHFEAQIDIKRDQRSLPKVDYSQFDVKILQLYEKRFQNIQLVLKSVLSEDQAFKLMVDFKQRRLIQIISQLFFTQKQLTLLQVLTKYHEIKSLSSQKENLDIQTILKEQRRQALEEYQQAFKHSDKQIRSKTKQLQICKEKIVQIQSTFKADKTQFMTQYESLREINEKLQNQLLQVKLTNQKLAQAAASPCKSCQAYEKQIQSFNIQKKILQQKLQKQIAFSDNIKAQLKYLKSFQSSEKCPLQTDKLTEVLIQKQNQKIQKLSIENNQLKQQIQLSVNCPREKRNRIEQISKLKKKVKFLQQNLSIIRKNFNIIKRQVIQKCQKQISLLKNYLIEFKKELVSELLNANGAFQRVIFQNIQSQILQFMKKKDGENARTNKNALAQMQQIDRDLACFIENCVNAK